MANGLGQQPFGQPTQLQQIGTSLQGFSAGLQGQLPQFQQAQNQKRQLQLQQQKQLQQQQQAAAEKKKKDEEARAIAVFTDAQTALRLLDDGDIEVLKDFGMQRLRLLKQLKATNPDIDPSDTQQLMRLAVMAGNPSLKPKQRKEAQKQLRGDLESIVKLGVASKVLTGPEVVKASEIIEGQTFTREGGVVTATDIVDFKPDPEEIAGFTNVRQLDDGQFVGLKNGEIQVIPETEAAALLRQQRPEKAKEIKPAARLASGFALRLEDSNATISELGADFTGFFDRFAGITPEGAKSDKRQKFDQAERNFVNATLRRESGAAINESEFERARIQYIPQPGNSEAVLEQKKRNRDVITAALALEAGEAFSELKGALGDNMINILGKKHRVGTILTNNQGQQGRVEADGSITPL